MHSRQLSQTIPCISRTVAVNNSLAAATLGFLADHGTGMGGKPFWTLTLLHGAEEGRDHRM